MTEQEARTESSEPESATPQEIARRAGFAIEGTEETALEKVAGVGIAARAQAEIQAAVVMALRKPRIESGCAVKILAACQRSGFAEDALYVFPRGGKQITGPSVNFAREAARIWGNIRYGVSIVDDTDERITIEGWAHDLETNAIVYSQASFKSLVQRKMANGKTEWVQPDERDRRELINRHGAIAVRNCILQLLPSDVVDAGMKVVRETLAKASKGQTPQDRDAALRRMIQEFMKIGVAPEQLEAYIGHKLTAELLTSDEAAELKGIYQSIVDGNSKRDDHFEAAVKEPQRKSEKK